MVALIKNQGILLIFNPLISSSGYVGRVLGALVASSTGTLSFPLLSSSANLSKAANAEAFLRIVHVDPQIFSEATVK